MEMPQNFEEMEKLIDSMEKRRRFREQTLVALPGSLELMSKGRSSHPLAGRTVSVKATGDEIQIEDWFEKIFGIPYLLHDLDRPPLIIYFCRMALDLSVPVDNDVVCVKFRGSGGLLHNSEIQESGG